MSGGMKKPGLGLLLGLCLAMLALGALAAGDLPPLPDRNPKRSGAAAKPPLPGEAETVPWSEAEIAAAKAECRVLLEGAAVDYEELAPMREGLCGAPAPILVRAAGSDPKVVIDPPATVRCPLAKALAAWLSETVQPKAKSEFGSTVVSLRNATSYACRNRYGGERTPISEHALANALDISEFGLASGEIVTVLKAWPVAAEPPPVPLPNPERDAKDEAGAKDDASDKSVSQNKDGAGSAQERPKLTQEDRVEATPASAAKAPPEAETRKPAPESETKTPAPEVNAPSTKFVRAMHAGACKAFGTVLGPAANAAHRDHFHFDMKKRRAAFCE